MIGPTSSSLRPEYTTSEPSPDVNSPPDADLPLDPDPPPEAEPPLDADPPSDADPPPESPCPHPIATNAPRTTSRVIEVRRIQHKNRGAISTLPRRWPLRFRTRPRSSVRLTPYLPCFPSRGAGTWAVPSEPPLADPPPGFLSDSVVP